MNIIHNISQNFVAAYVQFRYRRRFRYVLQCSYTMFSRRQPEWVDAGFDWHFLTHRVVPLITRLRDTGEEIPAAAMAHHWADQYTWSPARRDHRVSQATQIANEFLYIFMSELRICGLVPEKGCDSNHQTDPFAVRSVHHYVS